MQEDDARLRHSRDILTIQCANLAALDVSLWALYIFHIDVNQIAERCEGVAASHISMDGLNIDIWPDLNVESCQYEIELLGQSDSQPDARLAILLAALNVVPERNHYQIALILLGLSRALRGAQFPDFHARDIHPIVLETHITPEIQHALHVFKECSKIAVLNLAPPHPHLGLRTDSAQTLIVQLSQALSDTSNLKSNNLIRSDGSKIVELMIAASNYVADPDDRNRYAQLIIELIDNLPLKAGDSFNTKYLKRAKISSNFIALIDSLTAVKPGDIEPLSFYWSDAPEWFRQMLKNRVLPA